MISAAEALIVPVVDSEFASLIPPLSLDERNQLERNVIAEGCREPLIVWSNGNILLDGHNRLGICKSHNLLYSVASKDFADRDEAKRWMLENQLGRRNLTPESVAYLRGKLYREEKKSVGGDGSNQHEQLGKTYHKATTAEQLADRFKVTEKTIRNDAKFSEQLDELAEELGSDFQKEVLSRDSRFGRADIAELHAAEPEAKRKVWSAVKGGKTARDALRSSRREERIAKIVEISAGNEELKTPRLYALIYADPPWEYEHVKTANRGLDNHYPTMTLEAICAMPVADCCTPDAVLFLWTTSPKLQESFAVIEAWGFTYRTSMVWVKDKIGMGYYARQKHELLLICTRGSPPTPVESARPPSVIEAPRGRHSEKPVKFYELIESMYPELPKIELFSRAPRDGWDSFGNQAKEAS